MMNKIYKDYSVLMSVYYKENPDHLREAIESIQDQTLKTNDFVLVCDGPLTKELDEVISLKEKEIDALNVIRLDSNVGLGKALNEGLKYCKNELVARMDSDDIAYPDRCKKQVDLFNKYREISICSGTVEELDGDINNIKVKRVLPKTNDEILNFAKKRNPFNHPCVMYKKRDVEDVGSYQDFYLLEDYYLWVRMLLKGYKGYNIQEPILYMRAGSYMYKRRSGLKYARSQRALFNYMKEENFISNKEYINSCLIRSASSLAPNWLRRLMFEKVLRK